MTLLNTVPTYNLKVIVRETGIKPDTLRAWERRYGLPEPERTSGRHRLYSERDLEIVKWLMSRQEEGLSISRSVKLYRSMEKNGIDPLQESVARNGETAAVMTGTAVTDMRQAWIKACLSFDETAAEQILTQAFALYPPVMVCLEVLQKGLAEIGQLWYENKASVQQEHFASGLAMRRLNALVAAAPNPTRSERIIVACPAQESHVFSPLLLTLMLRYQGYEVIYLGANVPIARLESMIQMVRPSLIIMTAQQLYTAANLQRAAEFLQGEDVPVAYGGRIFNYVPAIRLQIPAHFLGEQLNDVIPGITRILSGNVPRLKVTSLPDTYKLSLIDYRAHQAAIENHVWALVGSDDENGINYESVANANLHLSREIIAALQLGDINLLGSEISWVENLMQNYGMVPEMLRFYLIAYHAAANKYLGENGRILIDWLANIIHHSDTGQAG